MSYSSITSVTATIARATADRAASAYPVMSLLRLSEALTNRETKRALKAQGGAVSHTVLLTMLNYVEQLRPFIENVNYTICIRRNTPEHRRDLSLDTPNSESMVRDQSIRARAAAPLDRHTLDKPTLVQRIRIYRIALAGKRLPVVVRSYRYRYEHSRNSRSVCNDAVGQLPHPHLHAVHTGIFFSSHPTHAVDCCLPSIVALLSACLSCVARL